MNLIKDRIIKCLDKNGIDLSGESIEIDSISFITAIIDLEREFDIEFPDTFLVMDSLSSLEKMYEIVSICIEQQ